MEEVKPIESSFWDCNCGRTILCWKDYFNWILTVVIIISAIILLIEITKRVKGKEKIFDKKTKFLLLIIILTIVVYFFINFITATLC
jgi:hypothetical protein